MMRTIPKRQLKRRRQRIGEAAYMLLIANMLMDGTRKASVVMCRQRIHDERIGEEFSRQPFLY
jgi:hypothetical protein